ncbi:MAG: DUF1003 domain-containing protein [Gaiellaceae bacterium]
MSSSSHSPFGEDTFGRFAEKTARFFGTPRYIIGQTIMVIIWIVLNGLFLTGKVAFDKYPFILLNLVFSTQAAYAAPLILLAQTRQADRDKSHGDMIDKRHTALERAAKSQTERLVDLLQENTTLTRQDKQLTEQVATLTKEIHILLERRGATAS